MRHLSLDGLFRRWRVIDGFHLCRGSTTAHQKASVVQRLAACVWSCATPGLGPRQMLANAATLVHRCLPSSLLFFPTPMAELSRGSIQLDPWRRVLSPWIYLYVILDNKSVSISVGSYCRGCFTFSLSEKETISEPFCFNRKLEFIDYITSMWGLPHCPFSFHFITPSIWLLFFCCRLGGAGLFVMKSKWRRFWLLALSSSSSFLFSLWGTHLR